MLCMEASRAARASAIWRSVAATLMVWDLGLEEEEEEAVGEVVEAAGSGLVVDMVGLWERRCYFVMLEGIY